MSIPTLSAHETLRLLGSLTTADCVDIDSAGNVFARFGTNTTPRRTVCIWESGSVLISGEPLIRASINPAAAFRALAPHAAAIAERSREVIARCLSKADEKAASARRRRREDLRNRDLDCAAHLRAYAAERLEFTDKWLIRAAAALEAA